MNLFRHFQPSRSLLTIRPFTSHLSPITFLPSSIFHLPSASFHHSFFIYRLSLLDFLPSPTYHLPTFLSIFTFSLFVFNLIAPASLHAQRSEFFRVADVQFSLERSPFGGDPWFEMELLLELRDNPDPSAPNREFVDHFQVEVALVNNVGIPNRPQLEYFWTRVEIPTLERGTHRMRFYLPPEQIERGRISNTEPYAWYIQISQGLAAGGDQPLNTAVAVSGNLREQPRLDRFLELLEEQKETRAGILLPQAETPFRDLYSEETPTIRGIRRIEE